MLKIFKKMVAGFVLTAAVVPVYAANTVIDILVVYTKGVADTYQGDPSARINQLFQVTNQIYADSNIDLEIRVAATMVVDYTDDNNSETALYDITFSQHEAFAGVKEQRVKAGADMVIFYRPYREVHGSCGQAWIMGVGSDGDFSQPDFKDYMYSHVAINSCGDFATAHELGHNMGLKHSRKQDGTGGTFPYALGHGEDNKFATIMAYQSTFNVDFWTGKVYKFASPELDCKGSPCGVDRNDPIAGADDRYALIITTPQIANYYSGEPASSSASSISTASSVSSVASSSVSSVLASNSSSSATTAGNKPDNTNAGAGGSSGGGGSAGFFWVIILLFLQCYRRKSMC